MHDLAHDELPDPEAGGEGLPEARVLRVLPLPLRPLLAVVGAAPLLPLCLLLLGRLSRRRLCRFLLLLLCLCRRFVHLLLLLLLLLHLVLLLLLLPVLLIDVPRGLWMVRGDQPRRRPRLWLLVVGVVNGQGRAVDRVVGHAELQLGHDLRHLRRGC